MQLSVVIPMFNEAENAAALVQEVRAALEGYYDYELLVVDDGSTDGTFEILDELARSVPALRPVRHPRNLGQSTAIASGVHLANAGWIATLDGDGQNDPRDIPSLVAHVQMAGDEDRPVLVAGNRRRRNDNWVRRLSSRIANRVRQRLLRDGCPDTGCGLKVFPRATFLQLPQFDHMHRFLPALFMRAGARVVNVPVNHRPRTRGQSKYGVGNRLWVGIADLIGMVWLRRRPLQPLGRETVGEAFGPQAEPARRELAARESGGGGP